jgi:hypothetical protein
MWGSNVVCDVSVMSKPSQKLMFYEPGHLMLVW